MIDSNKKLYQHVVTCDPGDTVLSGGFGLDNTARSFTIHITRPVHNYTVPGTPLAEPRQGWMVQVKIPDETTWTVWALCADTQPGD